MTNVSQHSSTSSLSTSQHQLVRLMQRINYGRIEGLSVRRGQPVLDPPPRVIRQIKFGGDNGPRPESVKSHFPLKAPVRFLFAQMEALGDGVIGCLEIQRGLPFRMIIEEACA